MLNKLVICGGTFDHLHKGHKDFLKFALANGEKVIIGLTTDDYVKKTKTNFISIEPFEVRLKNLEELILREGGKSVSSIIKLNDLYGPSLSRSLSIDAIIATKQTKKGADIINSARRKLGLEELKILLVPQVLAEDKKPISSVRIREGKIDREGKLLFKTEWFEKDFQLTEALRKELKKPFGEIITNKEAIDNKGLLVAVGDVTSKYFNTNSLEQNLSVIDFKVGRKEAFRSTKELGFSKNEILFTANNSAGHISSDLLKKLKQIFHLGFKEKIILKIEGEEDLVVLPLILFLPLHSIIFYGQPGQGMVKLHVSEEIKMAAYNIFLKLKTS